MLGGLLLTLLTLGLLVAVLYAMVIPPGVSSDEVFPAADDKRFQLVGRYYVKDAGARLFVVRDSKTGACYIVSDGPGTLEHVPPETCEP
ncbi:hypothetical protein JCM13210_02800 [Thermaerobacter litoralis]